MKLTHIIIIILVIFIIIISLLYIRYKNHLDYYLDTNILYKILDIINNKSSIRNFYKYTNNTNNIYKTYMRNPCKTLMSNLFIEILSKYSKYDDVSPDLIFPCSYDNPIDEYDKFKQFDNAIYFLIDGHDLLTAKNALYNTVREYYTKSLDNIELYKKLKSLMPDSFILHNDNDIQRLKQSKYNLYIVKKNIQRQTGLFITNSIDKILELLKNNPKKFPYVIAQELLQDPYLINGRKINLRIYVFIVITADKYNVYIYNDGFMYYTPKMFVVNNPDRDVNITTGYIDRNVYKVNPLTHIDFKNYLDSIDLSNNIITDFKNNPDSHDLSNNIITNTNTSSTKDKIFNNINKLIYDIFICYKNKLGTNEKLYKNTKCQLFGVDIAICSDLTAKLMEINKGPDLGAKDERDKQLKYDLILNMLNLIGITQKNDILNKFEQII